MEKDAAIQRVSRMDEVTAFYRVPAVKFAVRGTVVMLNVITYGMLIYISFADHAGNETPPEKIEFIEICWIIIEVSRSEPCSGDDPVPRRASPFPRNSLFNFLRYCELCCRLASGLIAITSASGR